MRIVYVITKGSWGGATKYVYDMATNMHKRDHEISVAYGTDGPLPEKLAEIGVPTFKVSGLVRDIGIFQEFKASFSLYRYLKKTAPDVVHLNSSKAAALGVVAARLAGVPTIIFTIHGWAFNERKSFIAKKIITFIYKFIISMSSKSIAVSDALKEQISPWSESLQNKIKVVPLGISFDSVDFINQKTESKKELRKKLSEQFPSLQNKESDKWVLTIAELHDNKGIDVMLGALATLQGRGVKLPQYLIVGDGEEKRKLNSLIVSYNLSESVHLLGFVFDAHKYILAADIFILPSRTEASGYVLLEAGIASIPVIATRVGGIPEIITHNEDGLLVPSESPAVLATAIEKLLFDNALRKKFSVALAEKVRSRYSIANMISATESVYTMSSVKSDL